MTLTILSFLPGTCSMPRCTLPILSLKSSPFLFIFFFGLYFLLQCLANLCSIFFGIVLCFLVGIYPYKLKGFIIGPLIGWKEGLHTCPKSACISLYKSFRLLVWIGGRSLVTLKVTRRRRGKKRVLFCLSYTMEWVNWSMVQWSEVAAVFIYLCIFLFQC